jgi:hypothetical protein
MLWSLGSIQTFARRPRHRNCGARPRLIKIERSVNDSEIQGVREKISARQNAGNVQISGQCWNRMI